jgi:hypothetical protein
LAAATDLRSYRLDSAWHRQSALLHGYVPVGTWAVRCDLTERLIVELTKPQVDGQIVVQSLLGCDQEQAAAILSGIAKVAGNNKRQRNARKRRRRKRRESAQQPPQEPRS